jgi:ElaB/YqjD/DUF883 family membrane-anchored ribosome-binding protein
LPVGAAKPLPTIPDEDAMSTAPTATPFPTSPVDGGTPNRPTTPSGTGEDLLGRVVQGAHEGIDRLAESAAPHLQKLQEGVNAAGDTLRHEAGEVRQLGDEWAESLRCTVRENPLTALLAAAALGVLLARLSR